MSHRRQTIASSACKRVSLNEWGGDDGETNVSNVVNIIFYIAGTHDFIVYTSNFSEMTDFSFLLYEWVFSFLSFQYYFIQKQHTGGRLSARHLEIE